MNRLFVTPISLARHRKSNNGKIRRPFGRFPIVLCAFKQSNGNVGNSVEIAQLPALWGIAGRRNKVQGKNTYLPFPATCNPFDNRLPVLF